MTQLLPRRVPKSNRVATKHDCDQPMLRDQLHIDCKEWRLSGSMVGVHIDGSDLRTADLIVDSNFANLILKSVNTAFLAARSLQL